MSNTISKALLAIPTFVAGPKDDLITLDAYNKVDKSIVNKIQDIAKIFDVDLTNIIRGGSIITENFPIIEDYANNVLKINQENLIARISSISRDVSSTLNQLGSNFIDNIKDIPLVEDVFVTVKDVTNKVKSIDISGLNEVGKLIDDITGGSDVFKVVDKDSVAGLYIGLLKEASKFQIPDTLGALIDQITDKEVLNKVISNVIPTAIGTSDVRMLKSIVENDSLNISNLLNNDIIKEFTSKYKQGFGFDKIESLFEFETLKEVFDSINPDWLLKTISDSEEVIDLSRITEASSDFKESTLEYVKRSTEVTEEERLMALTAVFDRTTVDYEIKNVFPNRVMKSTINVDDELRAITTLNT